MSLCSLGASAQTYSLTDSAVQPLASTSTLGDETCTVGGKQAVWVWSTTQSYRFVTLSNQPLAAGTTVLVKLRGVQSSSAYDNALVTYQLWVQPSGGGQAVPISERGGANHIGRCGPVPCEGNLRQFRHALWTVPSSGSFDFFATWRGASSLSSRPFGGSLCPGPGGQPLDTGQGSTPQPFSLSFEPSSYLELYAVDSDAQAADTSGLLNYRCFDRGRASAAAPYSLLSMSYPVGPGKSYLFVTGDFEVTVETGLDINSSTYATGYYRLAVLDPAGSYLAASAWASPSAFGQARHHAFMNPMLDAVPVTSGETVIIRGEFYWDAADRVAVLGRCVSGSDDCNPNGNCSSGHRSSLNMAWSGMTARTNFATDAGPVDAGMDAGADAGGVDAGSADAGAVDAGAVDAGAVDAGAVDAGAVDAGAVDVGRVDAGGADAGGSAGIDGGNPSEPGVSGNERGCGCAASECGLAVVMAAAAWARRRRRGGYFRRARAASFDS